MILAEKIMALRKKNGWSQEELAEKLNISRQSVSKWESGSSIPDLERIIAMSKLFDVSTDYLIKDEIEQEAPVQSQDVYEAPDCKAVSIEEANSFMDLVKKNAVKIAAGVSACILSPVPLILMGGISEYKQSGLTENMAGGIGVTILLVMIAMAVAVFIMSGMQLGKYEYMEKERLSLQYGVQGIVAKKKEEFAGKYQGCVVAGVMLCILAVVPLMVAAAFSATDLVLVYCTAFLLVLVSIGVFFLVWACSIQESYQKLLQEGDYTIEKKESEKKTSVFSGAYWCVVTAIFLIWGFWSQDWGTAALLWPVAGVLFAAVKLVVSSIVSSNKER